MRVFVVGTGRCGTVSFKVACDHITNFTARHETPCPSLEFDDNTIEVSPQLTKAIVNLSNKYHDSKWVHLVREPSGCIASLARLSHGDVMEHYRVMNNTMMPVDATPGDVAYRFYWMENDTIHALLTACVRPEQRMEICLESIVDQWPLFWGWIGAKGNLVESIKSWNEPQNTGAQRGEM